MPKNSEKKTLDVTIPVEKNKLKSERLFGKIDLKLACSISSNFIRKCLLCNIISEKSVLFDSNSQKTLMLFDKSSKKIFIVLFVSSCNNIHIWVITFRKYQYWCV